MASSRDSVVFDPTGDVFLLLAKDSGDDALTTDPSTSQGDGTPAKPAIQEVELQVSSKHLALASKVFGHVFSDNTREHDPSADRDLVTIPLLEDSYDAMVILLNIIHGRTRSVQRRVPFQTLLHITILINKYEFHEVTEVYTDKWFDDLRPTMPQHVHPDLPSWIYICWVLGVREVYTTLTAIAIHETDGGVVDPDGLVPLPYWIKDEIRSRQQYFLTKFLDMLSKLLKIYRAESCRCRLDPDCDASALGKFERALTKAGLYPIPEPSALEMSLDDLFSRVKNMDVSPLCKKLGKGGSYYSDGWDKDDEPFLNRNGKRQHIGEDLRDAISVIQSGLRGLTISNAGGSN